MFFFVEVCIRSPKNETQALQDMNDMDYDLTLLVQTATEYDWVYYTNESDAASNMAVGPCENAEC